MAQQDSFYSRLGVHTTATVDEIKKAYREKAKEYHPDLNPGEDSGVKFQAMTEAYEVLRNQSMRDEYDRLLRQRADSDSGGGGGGKEDVERARKWWDEGGWADVRWYTDEKCGRERVPIVFLRRFRHEQKTKAEDSFKRQAAQDKAWEAAKVEAQVNVRRRVRSARASERVRWEKAERVLKTQWVAQKGLQRQDLYFFAMMCVGFGGLALTHFCWPVRAGGSPTAPASRSED